MAEYSGTWYNMTPAALACVKKTYSCSTSMIVRKKRASIVDCPCLAYFGHWSLGSFAVSPQKSANQRSAKLYNYELCTLYIFIQLRMVWRVSTSWQESSLDDKLPELVALHGNKTGVPLNFLHVVLGRDAFPSVTDRSLFYNTDAELKKAMKQSQDFLGLNFDPNADWWASWTSKLKSNADSVFWSICFEPITMEWCLELVTKIYRGGLGSCQKFPHHIATVHNQGTGLVAHHEHLQLCSMPLYLCFVGHLCQEIRTSESCWCWWDLFGAAPATSPSSLC